MDDEGSIVRADRLLDDVRRIATDYVFIRYYIMALQVRFPI
jgi:hypothetical protein